MKARISLYIISGAIILIFIFILSAVFYLPWIHFKKITVTGNLHIPENELLQKLLIANLNKPFAKYLGYTNMLIWNNANISNPLIKKISVQRNWLDQSIDIKIEEQERYAVWCSEQNCFWITDQGQILEKAPQSEGQLMNIIYSNQNIDLKLGENILPSEKISYLKIILDKLNNLDISTLSMNYDVETLELTVKTSAGLRLLFSLYFNPLITISALEKVIFKQKFSLLEYIDFRTENKIYYK